MYYILLSIALALVAGQGDPDVAHGPGASASSSLSFSQPPSLAIDQTFATFYRSNASEPGVLRIDLGQQFIVTQISVIGPRDGRLDRFRDLQIVLLDGSQDILLNSTIFNPSSNCTLADILWNVPNVSNTHFVEIRRLSDPTLCADCSCCVAVGNNCTVQEANVLQINEVYVYVSIPNFVLLNDTLSVSLNSSTYNAILDPASLIAPLSPWVFNSSNVPPILNCSHLGSQFFTVLANYQGGPYQNSAFLFVRVTESVPPIARCFPFIYRTWNDANLAQNVLRSEVNDNSTDACGVIATDLFLEKVACSMPNGTAVRLLVTDSSGNTATCESLLNVVSEVYFAPNRTMGLATVTSPTNMSTYLTCDDTVFVGIDTVANASNSIWQQVSGPVGPKVQFQSASFTAIKDLPLGNSTFSFTAVGNQCDSSSTLLTIQRANVGPFEARVNQLPPSTNDSFTPFVNLGCAKTAAISGTIPTYGGLVLTGRWNPPFGANIVDNASPSTLMNMTGQTIFGDLRWTLVTTPGCFTEQTRRIEIGRIDLLGVNISPSAPILPCGSDSVLLSSFLETGGQEGKRVISSGEGTSPGGVSELVNYTWTVLSQPAGGSVEIFNFTSSASLSNLAIGTTTIRLAVTGFECVTRIADVVIIRPASAPRANAGVFQDIGCGSVATLDAATPTRGSGSWTVVAGNASVIFASPTSAKSLVSQIYGTVTLRWTITDGVCTSFDDVIIQQYAAVSPADGGAPVSIGCARSGYVNASVPMMGNGKWNLTGGSAFLDPSGGALLSFSGLKGNATLTWTVTGPNCPSSSDTVVISSLPPGTPACAACQEVELGGGNAMSSCDPPVALTVTENVEFNFTLIMTKIIAGTNTTVSFTSLVQVSGQLSFAPGSTMRIGQGWKVSAGSMDVSDCSVFLGDAGSLSVSGDLQSVGNVSYILGQGGKITAGGSLVLGDGGSVKLSSAGDVGLEAAQLVFAGRLILNLLGAVNNRAEVIVAMTAANPSTSVPAGSVVETRSVPVASFQGSSGSFSNVVVDGFSTPCETLLASQQSTTSSGLSVTLSVAVDQASAGCAAPADAGESVSGPGLSVGAIIGIVIGALVLVVVFAIVIIYLRKRELKRAELRFIAQQAKRSSVYQHQNKA